MYYLGFDIGGSNIKAALIKNKEIIRKALENTSDNLENLLLLLGKMKYDLCTQLSAGEISGVGFSIAGALDVEREKMLHSPNIPYLDGQPIKKMLEKKMAPLPIKLEHDVHCFLQAEKDIGLAKDLKNVFYLAVGTGVGGAFMINREIFIGAHGASGEAGHMIIERNSGQDFESLTANNFVKNMLGVTGKEAEQLARSGDKKAEDFFEERGKNLGIGIANIINVFDPEAVIIGGGSGGR